MSRTYRVLIATPKPGLSKWSQSHLSVLRMHVQTYFDVVTEQLKVRFGFPLDSNVEYKLADEAWSEAGSSIGKASSRFDDWNSYIATGADIWGDPNFDAVLVPVGPEWPGEAADYCVGRATAMMLDACISSNKHAAMLRRIDGSEPGYALDARPICLDVEDADSWTRSARLAAE